MSRFARDRRVFYLEEPLFEDVPAASIRISSCEKSRVFVCTPILPHNLSHAEVVQAQRNLLKSLLQEQRLSRYVAWYYTPMALEFSSELKPELTVYDCMDELSAFAGAPPRSQRARTELVQSSRPGVYGRRNALRIETKAASQRASVSRAVSMWSISQRRAQQLSNPADQASLPHPRLGYAGVIDERMDIDLVRRCSRAETRVAVCVHRSGRENRSPQAASTSPQHPLSGHEELLRSARLSRGWQIGMLPFALNESTRFISPTKTPEYLGGRATSHFDSDSRCRYALRRPGTWSGSLPCHRVCRSMQRNCFPKQTETHTAQIETSSLDPHGIRTWHGHERSHQ